MKCGDCKKEIFQKNGAYGRLFKNLDGSRHVCAHLKSAKTIWRPVDLKTVPEHVLNRYIRHFEEELAK